MSDRRRARLILAGLMLLGVVVFFVGDDWGLPKRGAGGPWSGAEIAAAGGAWRPDPHIAADADANPVTDRSRPIVLNETDAQRAEIIRRYRLFSAQPDEMVTFKALAGMKANGFDPRMYQYGGLWIYPVGAMLKVAGACGLVTVRPDFGYYLDHPEEFGRFYVVARVYSGLWGLVGVWGVFALVRRFSERLTVPATAAACFILLPVVVNAAHEAKPHLAGAVLMILSVLAGVKYVETGGRKWAVVTGALCGAAVGMVLSAVVILVLIPVMDVVQWRVGRKDKGRQECLPHHVRRAVVATGVAVLVYCVTNPYVPINLVKDRAVVMANLGALSQAKAIVGRESEIGAVANARRLIVDGASIVGGVIGVTGLLVLLFNQDWWRENGRGRVVVMLLGAPAGLVLVQFVMLAGGKGGEFGRFAILPDVALMISGVVLVTSLKAVRDWPGPVMASLVMLTGFQGGAYWAGFVEDARGAEATRRVVARRLDELWGRGARTIGVRAEPAPYCLPAVDVTKWTLILLPADGELPQGAEAPDVMVWPVDELERGGVVPGTPYARRGYVGEWPWVKTRISWADKPFDVYARRALAEDSPR